MILTATVACNGDDGDLSFVSFYDQEKLYGLSFSCNSSDRAVEVMVGDQSSYSLSGFEVRLSRERVLVTLPPGTIDPIDGEDQYEVIFEIDEQDFAQLLATLSRLLQRRAHLHVAS